MVQGGLTKIGLGTAGKGIKENGSGEGEMERGLQGDRSDGDIVMESGKV